MSPEEAPIGYRCRWIDDVGFLLNAPVMELLDGNVEIDVDRGPFAMVTRLNATSDRIGCVTGESLKVNLHDFIAVAIA